MAIEGEPTLQQIQQFLIYHLISIVVVIIISVTILVHYYGSKKNRQIANKYQEVLSPQLSQYFRKYDGELVYESPNIYKIYPSDRDSCLFAIISFALIPRQQLLSFFLNSLIFRLKDELVIEIPVNNENPMSLTGVIIRKKQIKTITKKNYPDVKQLCKEYRPIVKAGEDTVKLNVPDTHCLLVEKVEHVRYFIYSEKQAKTWKDHGKSVKMVYISDVNKFSRYPMAVRMVMNLSKSDIPPMFDWLISFIDRMAKAKMSMGERREALKKRETLSITYQ